MKYVLIALITAQLTIDISFLWTVYIIGKHDASIDNLVKSKTKGNKI